MHRAIENFAPHSSLKEDAADELQVNLETCLELFTEDEHLTVNNSWLCTSCNKYVPSKKQLSLKSLPPVLIIHLKRFQYTTIYRDKITSLVNFPLRDFDLSRFVVDPAKPPIYDLYAISNHIGGMSGGHYTCYALNQMDNVWYKLDDSHCTSILDPSFIVTPNAYLLFYKLRDGENYPVPESIQLDDEEESPKPAAPAVAPPAGSAAEEPKPQPSSKENAKFYPPNEYYEPEVTPDDEGAFHEGYPSDYGPYAPPARKPLAQSLYICAYCSATLPGLEEYQVHILTAHYGETGTEDLLLH